MNTHSMLKVNDSTLAVSVWPTMIQLDILSSTVTPTAGKNNRTSILKKRECRFKLTSRFPAPCCTFVAPRARPSSARPVAVWSRICLCLLAPNCAEEMDERCYTYSPFDVQYLHNVMTITWLVLLNAKVFRVLQISVRSLGGKNTSHRLTPV